MTLNNSTIYDLVYDGLRDLISLDALLEANMTSNVLSETDAQSIIDHMNKDHSDTLINYVRYFGGVKDVISAELHSITQHELYIDIVAHALACRLAVPLIQSIHGVDEARAVLVEMAKQAREGLHRDMA